MDNEPEQRVELGKNRPQDAPAPVQQTQKMWTDDLPPRELPPPVEPPAAPQPGPARAEAPWAGIERPAPPVELPPYPPPPPAYPPVYPVAGPMAYGAPRYPGPVPHPPGPQPRYGYADNTPIMSILSFCCVAASVLGGAMLCGLPVLFTAPTGIVLGVIGHHKGEQMGKWAAIANAVVAALAAVVVVAFIALFNIE
ncbi:hypothetical protein [Nocardia neocaledoniensis]|uniref:hypothetical protein n=1 Tax=Nocardia neocaledoniensis TaxID=236511 RepID=UPI0024548EE8|nr:hypothetical protein [Nocardia neocaledoniensis]